MAVLWGNEHVVLGEMEVISVSPRAALAISKGKEAKQYRHVDPNEDAVAGVAGDQGVLLVCADGHRGFDSVPVSVDAILGRLSPSLSAVSEADLVSAFASAQQALLDRLQQPSCANPDSRTTLVVAVIVDRSLRWATMGDSALFVASPTEVRRLDTARHRFMGWPEMTADRVVEELQTGEAEVRPGSWVVLATDGFVDFAPHSTPEEAVWEACESAATAEDLARALVELAFSGGAADSVAVAVAGPTG